MSNDLVTFLQARLDEDEEIARQAIDFADADWRLNEEENVAQCLGMTAWDGPQWAPVTDGRWKRPMIDGPGLVPHVARHDPARVLAEVEAKRALIDLCSAPMVEVTGPGDIERQFVPGAGAGWAEPALRLLALPYADHPDYRQEWRP